MDHSFRNLPPGFSFPATSASQQQASSQATTAGQPAYPLAHPGQQDFTGYSPVLQESAFTSMQMLAPEQSYSGPSVASFEPMLPNPLQGWAHEPDPQDDHAAALQEWSGAQPMQGCQGFVADPAQMPPAHALVSPPFMPQQGVYPVPNSWHAPLPIINQQAASGMQAPHTWVQPSDSSAAPGPSQGKHTLADAAEALGPIKRARRYKKTHTQSNYGFANESTGKRNFNRNREVLHLLGYRDSFEMNEVLLACEAALPEDSRDDKGQLRDADYKLTLAGNGHTAHVFWRIKNHKTALWSIAAEAEQLRQKVDQIKKTEAGKRAKVLSRAGVISNLDIDTIINNIRARSTNVLILEALGYGPEAWTSAIRTLSARCDSVLGTAQNGDSVSDTPIPNVQHFKLTRFGPEEKDVEVLRWVEANDVRQLILFYEGGLDAALNTMWKAISLSNLQRERHQAAASLPAQEPPINSLPPIDNGGTHSIVVNKRVDSKTVGNIITRHGNDLTAMGWTDVRAAVRLLAELCERTVRNPQGGNTVSGTSLRGVQHFSFPHGGPEGQAVEVLRWKFDDKVCDIHPFKKDELDNALKKMEGTMQHSLAARGIRMAKTSVEGEASA